MPPAEARACAVLLAMGMALGAGQALAADVQDGRLLYETYCGACHYPKLHDRKATKIRSYAVLKGEVARWAAQQGSRRFTPAEVDAITEYLNESHYRVAK